MDGGVVGGDWHKRVRVLVPIWVDIRRSVRLLAALVVVRASVWIEAKDGGTQVNWINGWP